ncbi:hypothetical protein BpHYR1_052024 [Brachionus plicatilis]|uniref:Uncharacterized protein n=1 Tax=Brachionus plicatilis TaxID=10195 RepID=A0A3M7P2K1_BRAPC|nr:hypothetical protein BpHYR1_052024 [Brachionus plicatilis]
MRVAKFRIGSLRIGFFRPESVCALRSFNYSQMTDFFSQNLHQINLFFFKNKKLFVASKFMYFLPLKQNRKKLNYEKKTTF